MTSLFLMLWIVGGILLQLVIYLGIVFSRHWLDYQALRRNVAAGTHPHPARDSGADPVTAAWSGLRSFKVIQKNIEDGAQEICSFQLVPEDGQALPPFLPGQFLTFRLDLPTPAGVTEPLMRCYSLSDAPRPSSYRVSIKRAPAPANSALPAGRASNYFHDQVQVGSRLQVRAPAGHFHIDRSDAPVVLIGAGIGITPMLSMLNWCLAEQPGREVWLFYGVRNSRELMQPLLLEALAAQHENFHLNICLSHSLPEDSRPKSGLHQGRIGLDLLRQLLPLKPYHYYICGPTALLESLVPALENWGVPEARIHFEAFGPASITRKKSASMPSASLATPASEPAVAVTFAKSGKPVSWQPGSGSLLDLAEANGISVTSGCRAGGCGSCQTTILAGQVAYRQAPDFDPEPGTCLLCVCTPKTSLTLEL